MRLLILLALLLPAVVAAAQSSLPPPVERYNRWAGGLESLVAGGRARLGAAGEKERGFNLSAVLARPDRARMQGRLGHLTTVFDLAAENRGWTLFLPRERKVVRSPSGADRAGLLVPPAELIAVLLPAPVDPGLLEAGGTVVPEGREVRVVVPPAASGGMHRVLRVEAATGRLLALELRERTQLERPVLVATYADYEGDGGSAYPRTVRVELDGGGQWARFELETARPGEEVDPRRFRILIPPGTEEIAPEALSPDFLPEVEP